MHKVGPVTQQKAIEIDAVFATAVITGTAYKFRWDQYDVQTLKRGNIVLAECGKGGLSICKVTSVKMNMLGENDVRVSDGQYSWRADKACKLS